MQLVTESLLREIDELHPLQQLAVLHDGNVVLRAGPGSGKTRSLVARAAYLLQTKVPAFRQVACITYTTAAADEVRRRVARCGVPTDGRLTCSTVHAFCLNEILRGFSALTGEVLPEAGQVLSETGVESLLQDCFDEVGIAEVIAKYRAPAITKIRRALVCDTPLEDFDQREVAAARLFEQRLTTRGEIDFEAMVTRALHIVRSNATVRDLLRARFPYLIVDEYQDLGGVLHELVLALHDMAGIIIFAVGDVDQSLYGFTGAEPRFLDELAARDDFLDVPLAVNYRSGQGIITAAEAALGEARGRSARDDAPQGEVNFYEVEGDLEEHAQLTADLVQQTQERGVALDRIAVLYPMRGRVLDTVLAELTDRGIPHLFERDDKLPTGSLSRFIQRCAGHAVTNAQLQAAPSSELHDLLLRAEAPTILDLASDLDRLRTEADMPAPPTRLAPLRTLQQALNPTSTLTPETPAYSWLAGVRMSLELDQIATSHPDQENGDAVETIAQLIHSKALTLQDLARATQILGKAVVTTYHSSKGREFDTVILPGLVNGILPRNIPSLGQWRPPSAKELAEQRRTFYVALTRAEQTVHIITGWHYTTPRGYWIRKGPSDIVVEMRHRLNA